MYKGKFKNKYCCEKKGEGTPTPAPLMLLACMFIQCKYMVNLENCQLILNKLQCMFSKKKCQAHFYYLLDLIHGVVQSY